MPDDEANSVYLVSLTTGAVRSAPWISARTGGGAVFFANLLTKRPRDVWQVALRVLVQFQQFFVLVSSWVLPFLCLCRGAFGQLLAFGSHSLLDVTTLSSATTCPVLLPCDPVTAL